MTPIRRAGSRAGSASGTPTSLVTDYDVGVAGEAVTVQAVLEAFAASIERLRMLLAAAVARIGEAPPGDACRQALDAAALQVGIGPIGCARRSPPAVAPGLLP